MTTQPAGRSTAQYQALDAAHHIHAFLDQQALNRKGARVMVRGSGLRLWDSDGNSYLDGMAGLWCTQVGYGRPELVAAASRQMEQLSYYNLFFNTTHPAVLELSERLFELLPGNRFSHVIYTNSGSEAIELLIRTVRRFWDIAGRSEKKILIGRRNGYHGSTVGSASLGGMAFMHQMGDLPIPNIEHVGEPYWFAHGGELDEEEFGRRSAAELEARILQLGADKVAAFVAEPFQGAGGMIFPPASYWAEIQRICRRHDVLLCADEVIGGFGRTGEWFAHQHFDFEPDLLAIAKGLTSGYVPMGGLVMSNRVARALVEEGGVFAHGLTYSGHPVAAAVALANLELLHEEGIVERVRVDTGPHLQACLRDAFARHPLIGEIQGAGMVAALQLADGPASRRRFANEAEIATRCHELAFDDGIIIRATAGRLIFAPALVISRTEIDELVSKTVHALARTAREFELL